MKLLIKIPTRERGFDWLKGYIDNCTSPDTKILLSLDNGQPEPPEWAMQSGRVWVEFGHSVNKVHAYNRDIPEYIDGFDVLMCGSDDMWVKERGYDDIICNDMRQYFPDGDGCLWYDTEDAMPELKRRLNNRTVAPGDRNFLEHWICMLPIMGATYYRRFGYVYHPSYHAFWCDNEQTKHALKDRKIKYIHRRIISHEHPSWGGGVKADSLYTKANTNWTADMNNFRRRQSHGFPT